MTKKLNVELPCGTVTPLAGIYPQELKAGTQADMYSHMFRAASFTAAKRWKQPKCPLTDEWINKCGRYIQPNIIKP